MLTKTLRKEPVSSQRGYLTEKRTPVRGSCDGYKLWELEKSHAIFIICFCLTCYERKGLSLTLGGSFSRKLKDIEIVSILLEAASDTDRKGIIVQAFLDEKYSSYGTKFAVAKNGGELQQLFDTNKKNNITGAFWAGLRNRYATGDFVKRSSLELMSSVCQQTGTSSMSDLNMSQGHSGYDSLSRNDLLYELETALYVGNKYERQFILLSQIYKGMMDASPEQSRRSCKPREQARRLVEENRSLEMEVKELQRQLQSRDSGSCRWKLQSDHMKKCLECSRRELRSLEETIFFRTPFCLTDSKAIRCSRGCGIDDGQKKTVLFLGGVWGLFADYKKTASNSGVHLICIGPSGKPDKSRLTQLIAKASGVICAKDGVDLTMYREIKTVCQNKNKPLLLLLNNDTVGFSNGLKKLSSSSVSS